MAAILAWWGGSAVLLVALGGGIGLVATGRLLGLLIDSRGRYSLTHLQLALWIIVILSLLAGVFFGRWQHNVDPLGFTIPPVVLGLLGISVGSAVTVTAAKTAKDTTRPAMSRLPRLAAGGRA
jgi:FtsH-binding integral membrane protein